MSDQRLLTTKEMNDKASMYLVEAISQLKEVKSLYEASCMEATCENHTYHKQKGLEHINMAIGSCRLFNQDILRKEAKDAL